jgi:hypothetical protein
MEYQILMKALGMNCVFFWWNAGGIREKFMCVCVAKIRGKVEHANFCFILIHPGVAIIPAVFGQGSSLLFF